MCQFGLALHSCGTPVIFIPLFFHLDGLLFRTWRLLMTGVELQMGPCFGPDSAGTAFAALASCAAESPFASKHAVLKAQRSLPVVFPCTKTSYS